LEIGNLGPSLPELKIQKILDGVAKYLGQKIKKSCYMQIEVDTAEFSLDQNGYIDEKASIEKIASEIDRLCLDELAGFKGLIVLEDIAYVIRYKDILERIANFGLTPHMRENLELIKKCPIKQWIEACKDHIIQGSKVIKSIIGDKTESLLIEIHTQGIYPSKAAMLEINSFINHIKRHIDAQLDEKQLQPNKPNIIVIQCYNWIMFPSVWDLLGIKHMYKEIKAHLIKKEEKYLSGIALFSTDFSKTVFISNGKAEEASKISKDEVEELGMIYMG